MTTTEILNAARNLDLGPAEAAFALGNNAGDGFDPDADIGGWDLVHAAETDDSVSVYTDGEDVVLVGDANGAWAVRVVAE